ncbi:ATP-grasp domain-containing protein [Acidithiobacillus concretivorus]|uniref:ATP-grasp domain-containing protein n=1 Tax=Acidithiobacillus concretivorus TaxID=3063952 RepID=A0ABS5ZSR2_9PROT|nr:ATP-grasp domain-containing protein [Acidithiobacillus concretivorus]MBU2739594.1 ATP-grasp domain-containing protein [Acidithiobacillus concretivorus]
MTKVVLQRHFSLYPGMAVRAHADHLTLASVDEIKTLQKSGWMPVGSVEFCLAAMIHQEVDPSFVSSYPKPLQGFLHRKIWLDTVAGVIANGRRVFVKPSARQKLFTGFVWPDGDGQEIALKDLPANDVLWCADPVSFTQEWRYYVCNGKVLGAGRYDDNDAEDPVFEMMLHYAASEMAKQYQDAPAGYSIDLGVLDDGKVALVEVNDGWALGFYSGSCASSDYFDLLCARWDEITGIDHG